MAIYHLTTHTFTRSKGQSATAAAAYRSGEIIHDERTGLTHDWRQYRKTHGEALAAEIVLPSDAPEAFRDRSTLWNAAEGIEKTKRGAWKKAAVVAREVEASLPHELDDAQRIELARSHAVYLAKRYGVAVDMAVHPPDGQGDKRNRHVHFLLSSREVGKDGFGEKAELELSGSRKEKLGLGTGQQQIREMREAWGARVNGALKFAGVEASVDHRSLDEQGIAQEPTKHLGEVLHRMKRKQAKRKEEKPRLIQHNEEVEFRNARRRRLDKEIARERARQGQTRTPANDAKSRRRIILDWAKEQRERQTQRHRMERAELDSKLRAARREKDKAIKKKWRFHIEENRRKEQALKAKLGQTGMRGFIYRLRHGAAAREDIERAQASRRNAEMRQAEDMGVLDKAERFQHGKLSRSQGQRSKALERRINEALETGELPKRETEKRYKTGKREDIELAPDFGLTITHE